ncbi:MAG: murein biosynthesis integral membrane protein MurJ [Bdellovibrionota bacterium]
MDNESETKKEIETNQETNIANTTLQNENKTIIKGTSIVGILTLVSRIAGFFRDLVFASLFGSGMYADAFFVAFKIPNMLRSFVAEGALTSAFVPLFSEEVKKGEKETRKAFREVGGFLLLVTSLLSVLGIIFAKEITLFFAPGFENVSGKLALASNLTKIMFPYIIFISFVSLANGALSVFKIFGVSATSQILMNIIMIIFAFLGFFFTPYKASHLMAISVIVSGVFMCLLQVRYLRRVKLTLLPSFRIFNKLILNLIKLMLPAIVGAGVYQLTIFINTVIASMLSEGSVSWLFYADRFSQIPIGIFTISLASVLLPSLSKFVVNGQKKEFHDSLKNALSYTSFFIVPVSFYIFLIAEPCIQVFLQRKAFDSVSTLNTASALKAYAIGIWGISSYTILVRAFLAKKDTKTPTVLSMVMLILHFHISLLMCGKLEFSNSISAKMLYYYQEFLYNYFPFIDLGHIGLALSASISSSMGFLILFFIFKLKDKAVEFDGYFSCTIKSFLASIGMYYFTSLAFSLNTSVLLKLILSVVFAFISYFVLSHLLRIKEIREAAKLLVKIKNKVLRK